MTARPDFLNHLKETFKDRCRQNPQYSLRAFARSLKIQPAPLSEILRGKRPITTNLKRKLGLALGLNSTELEHYSTAREREARGELYDYQRIDDAKFSMMCDWYYYAILELFKVPGFEATAHEISKRLNLKVNQINLALDNLKILGFVTSENLVWHLSNENMTCSLVSSKTNEAKRNFQKQLLRLSSEAIDNVDIRDRDHSSITIAIDKSDLNEARELTKKYRQEMIKLLTRSETKTDVYQLQISLFPLTRTNN